VGQTSYTTGERCGRRILSSRSLRGLAGEFVLIVVGVLVALAVESWRQEQSDIGLVGSYLVYLETELVQDTFIARVYSDVSRYQSVGIERLLTVLDGAEDLSPREELLSLYWAYNDEHPLYVSAVLDELLVTGNARLLASSILAALQGVSHRFEISGAVMGGLNFPLEDRVPGIVPGHMRRALREAIRTNEHWIFDDGLLAAAADSLPLGATEAEREAIARWRSIPEIRALLEQQFYSSEAYAEELQQDRAAMDGALQTLATSDRCGCVRSIPGSAAAAFGKWGSRRRRPNAACVAPKNSQWPGRVNRWIPPPTDTDRVER